MKEQMIGLAPKILSFNNSHNIAIGGHNHQLMFNFFIYKCLTSASMGDVDIQSYTIDAAKMIYNYLSIPIMNIINRVGFISSFFQTYVMFNKQAILSSVFDDESVLYDDSTESKIARVLAIGEREASDFSKAVLETVENLL